MDLITLGFAAALYQRPPKEIAACLPVGGMTKPELILNGIPHYRAEDIAKAVGFLVEIDAKKSAEASTSE